MIINATALSNWIKATTFSKQSATLQHIWKHRKRLTSHGISTRFTSIVFFLSAADKKWPSLVRCHGKLGQKECIDGYIKNEMTCALRCHIIASHPAAVSRYINNCGQKFIKCVIYSQHAPLGTVNDLLC